MQKFLKYLKKTDQSQKINNFQANQTDIHKKSNPQSQKFSSNLNQNFNEIKCKYKNLIFSPSKNDYQFFKHLLVTYMGAAYIQECLEYPQQEFEQIKQIVLPRMDSTKKKTLFLDLDETLIHSQPLKIVKNESVNSENYKHFQKVNVRPFCQTFLEQVSQFYEIFIFTASQEEYAQKIIDVLDPQKKIIDGIIARNCCLNTKNGLKIKDLKIIKNRQIERMVLVDNLAYSFGTSFENGIPILGWEGDENDKELLYLGIFLIDLAQQEDVRPTIRKHFKIQELGLEQKEIFKNIQQYINSLSQQSESIFSFYEIISLLFKKF